MNKNIQVVKNLIENLDEQSLRNVHVVANLVRAFGIVQWGAPAFGDDEVFKNERTDQGGIYQTPYQIAPALIEISKTPINSFCEIGVFQGGNFLFTTWYLRRFNPDMVSVGVDPTDFLNPEIRSYIMLDKQITILHQNSDSVRGQEFDLVIIDGDHSEYWVERDYELVGKYAKICFLHDIQEPNCPDCINFWNRMKDKFPHTSYTEYTSPGPTQGIGLLWQR